MGSASRDELKEAVGRALRDLESLPFPEDMEEELSAAHAELALLDGHIVGLVQSLLAGQRVPVSDLRADPGLRSRLQQAAVSSGDIGKAATEYLIRLSALERLIAEARSVASRS